ncbi:hypothetical protein LXL04_023381 [Taraxacum kok-saghyz]
MDNNISCEMKVETGDAGYVLEDVPHLSDYIPDLPTYPNPLRSNPAYSVVKQYFVDADDTVPQKVVVHKDGPRGIHFRRAGPRQRVYFTPDEVHAAIVTCGGLCPGLNTVIREIVCALYHMYGVTKVLGIDGGYRGFYSKNTITLTPKVVNDIHKRGGTIIGTSRGGHDKPKIVDSIQDRGINQVYIIGGDGTQKGAAVIYQEVRRRGLKAVVAGIPKTIDNDIPFSPNSRLPVYSQSSLSHKTQKSLFNPPLSHSHKTQRCECDESTTFSISRTDENPGRKFQGCPNFKDKYKKCDFFLWLDPPLPNRHYKEIMCNLYRDLERAKDVKMLLKVFVVLMVLLLLFVVVLVMMMKKLLDERI